MWFIHKRKTTFPRGLVPAFGIFSYILSISLFMSNSSRWFGKMDNHFFAPVLFLTLFVVSAMVCGLMMFYKPYLLFMEKKYKDAVNIVFSSTAWLVGFMVVALLLTLFVK